MQNPQELFKRRFVNLVKLRKVPNDITRELSHSNVGAFSALADGVSLKPG